MSRWSARFSSGQNVHRHLANVASSESAPTSRLGASLFQLERETDEVTRLKTVRPRVGKMSTRLARPPGDERARDQHRKATQPWRAWYGTKRWRDLRQAVLMRDEWRCQATGVLLVGKAPAPDSPVVDHITPHRGDPALFWDIDNLQSVAKSWHDSTKQSLERREGGV